jgi:hypothetical protein
MKGIVLAVGVGLTTLGLTEAASAQQPCSAPVVCQPTCTTYWGGCCSQPVIRYYPAARVCTPTCEPNCWTQTYRYVTYRPYPCWTPAYSCHARVIHRCGWCR